MGFCPYFLHDQRSEGGPSHLPALLEFSIFTVIIVFSGTFLHSNPDQIKSWKINSRENSRERERGTSSLRPENLAWASVARPCFTSLSLSLFSLSKLALSFWYLNSKQLVSCPNSHGTRTRKNKLWSKRRKSSYILLWRPSWTQRERERGDKIEERETNRLTW